MSYRGPEFYDDEQVFAHYSSLRNRRTSPNETIELPIIKELSGSVTNLDVLDLGCGNGLFGKSLLSSGAKSYFGVDGSKKMIEVATSNLVGSKALVVRSDIETWEFPESSFDLVTARLVFHYLPDLGKVLSNIRHTLKPNGRLIFSVEHPVITASDKTHKHNQTRQDWIVDDYFNLGVREVSWLGANVLKYHRTIQGYLQALETSGFTLKALRESNPDASNISDPSEYRRRQRIPLFLILVAQNGE